MFAPRPLSIAVACVTAMLFVQTASAAEPKLEQVGLFEAGTDGYALYRIPGPVSYTHLTLPTICSV